MQRNEIVVGIGVIDRWYKERGTGIVSEVKKTRFTVIFDDVKTIYDFPHAQFLERVEYFYPKTQIK